MVNIHVQVNWLWKNNKNHITRRNVAMSVRDDPREVLLADGDFVR